MIDRTPQKICSEQSSEDLIYMKKAFCIYFDTLKKLGGVYWFWEELCNYISVHKQTVHPDLKDKMNKVDIIEFHVFVLLSSYYNLNGYHLTVFHVEYGIASSVAEVFLSIILTKVFNSKCHFLSLRALKKSSQLLSKLPRCMFLKFGQTLSYSL